MNRFQAYRWNESQWESEIRRDERRINAYFSGLLEYMDLPGEEELIEKHITKNPDLFSEGSVENALHCWSYLVPDSQEEGEDSEFDSDAPNTEQLLIDLLDELNCQWNETYTKYFPAGRLLAGIFVSGHYSKLLARFTDFADSHAAPESSPALTRTLGKLVLIDMATVIELLNSIPKPHSAVSAIAEKHIRNLHYIHHRVVSLLEQLDKD